VSETTTQAERHVDILKRADVVADEQINDRFISYNNTVTISKHFIEEFEEVSSAPDPGEDLAKTVAKKSHMENYPGTSPELLNDGVEEREDEIAYTFEVVS
jgi:hypothetical protein